MAAQKYAFFALELALEPAPLKKYLSAKRVGKSAQASDLPYSHWHSNNDTDSAEVKISRWLMQPARYTSN